MLNWHIGKQISEEVLAGERAEYGKEIVVSLIRQLSWTHFLVLIPLKDDLQRQFYAEMCRVERWSVRILRAKIDSMLYERTGISKKPAELARQELTELPPKALLEKRLRAAIENAGVDLDERRRIDP